ncbi:MAG: hypothetical protein IT435_18730 [Phycisphaerales bacterium]|nr:hypothetical protein [Phycisphaerales bacterium]
MLTSSCVLAIGERLPGDPLDYMYEVFAACIGLCALAGRSRRLGGSYWGSLAGILVWMTMPLWIDRTMEVAFYGIEPCIPDVLTSGLGTIEAVVLQVIWSYIIVLTVVAAPLYLWMTRSRTVVLLTAIGCVVSLAVIAGMVHWITNENWFNGFALMATYHLGAVGPVLWWAIWGEPRRTPGRCAGCGYDLLGLMGERCPECGEDVEANSEPSASAGGREAQIRQ